MNIKYFALLCCFILSACAGSNEYLATGSHNNNKYVVKITIENVGLKSFATTMINGDVVNRHQMKVGITDSKCKKPSTFTTLCTYTAQYDGLPVQIERGQQLQGGGMAIYNYVDVYIDGELLQRVPIYF